MLTSLSKIMTNEEKAWLAGFVDGEGYIGILKQRKKTSKQQSDSLQYHPYLIVSGTDKKTIEYLKDLTGCGWVVVLPRKGNYKTAYQYKVTKFDDLFQLLHEIRRFLKIKQRQCELLMEFINIRKNIVTKTGRGSRGFTSFSETEETIYHKLRQLNLRGL